MREGGRSSGLWVTAAAAAGSWELLRRLLALVLVLLEAGLRVLGRRCGIWLGVLRWL